MTTFEQIAAATHQLQALWAQGRHSQELQDRIAALYEQRRFERCGQTPPDPKPEPQTVKQRSKAIAAGAPKRYRKLTPGQVREIRQRYQEGGGRRGIVKELTDAFQVRKSTMSDNVPDT